ncbi:ESX secretion-associated protein EspG [Actinophytocola oryzae]|uniref:ESAT-6 protein secretion system EspG family protein n=1 Tax=Actinophytocola oryzae TaxID=502181 RepID=A0A4V3FQR5_9PSEU|nr:ESX secretion-associated protein EspG [Actinophytocola oryzae]TDV40701.1 ESAT-6 protein secretion system EspG family protein [Actinophytocola oryzae]
MRERTLSPIALDFVWEALDAGEPPYPLEVQSHGATVDGRRMLRQRVREDLIANRLLTPAGRLEPELEEWLLALANADLSIDSVFLPDTGAEPVLALAASGRGAAVLAVQQKSGLHLRPIPRDGLVSAVVGMLPPARRGTETSISLPAAELAAVGGGVNQRASDVETRKALARLTALPNQRGGQIAVNSRTEMRGRRRSPVLSWFDNETGRYLTQSRADWATIAPADAATLRQRLIEMTRLVTVEQR